MALLEFMNVAILLVALGVTGQLAALPAAARDSHLLSIGVVSALLKAGSSIVYQRAMQLSPISLSIPYLAFTPTLLLITSYVLLGERPSWHGVVGVVVMTGGAYGLNAAGRGQSSPRARRGESASNEKVIEKELARARGAQGNGSALGGIPAKARRASEEPPVAALVGARFGSVPGRGWVRRVTSRASRRRRRRRPSRSSRRARRSGGCRDWRACFPAEPGSRLMLCVAVLWSLTSDLDKMGKTAASSFAVFVAVQRVCMSVPLGAALVAQRSVGKATTAFGANLPLLFALAMLEMFTMSAYLKALDHLYVSYAIAPRGAVSCSRFWGAVLFKESIRSRLPYVVVILFGMFLVLLSGSEEGFGQRVRRGTDEAERSTGCDPHYESQPLNKPSHHRRTSRHRSKEKIRSRLPVKRTRVEIDFHRVSLKGEIVGISGRFAAARGSRTIGPFSAGAQEDL